MRQAEPVAPCPGMNPLSEKAGMLRILTFSTLFPHGQAPGFGRFVADQSVQLARQPDCAVKVVAPLPRRPLLPRRFQPLADLPLEEEWEGMAVHRPRFTALPRLGGWYHPKALVAAARPVLEAIRAGGFDFDVIDAEFFFPCGVAAVRLGEIFNRPVSIMARGSDIHYWGRHPAARRAMREAGAGAARLLAVSAAMRRDMIALGLAAEKIHVHHMGIDLSAFAPRPRAAEKEKWNVEGPLLLSAGNLIALKGHDIMISALRFIPQAQLLIARDGPERAALEKHAARNAVAARVRFLGAVPHQQMPSLMAAADIMTLASEREGLATAWIESLACGTPIVAPRVGGIAEVITAPSAGRIATARSPQAMAQAIRMLLHQPPSQEDVRAHAQIFDWQRRIGALMGHFSAIRR